MSNANGYDFRSPLVKMPFGNHKGTIFWMLPLTYLNWMIGQPLAEYTKQTIEDAIKMQEGENLGCFAVLRKHKHIKFLVRLKSIHLTKGAATAHCDDTVEWADFVHHIDTGNKID